MDDPALDEKIHQQALAGLRRVNSLSRTAAVFERAIVASGILNGSKSEPIRVLDIACGGGDLVIQLSRRLQKYGRTVEVEGCDISPTAIAFANKQATDAGYGGVRFFKHDVLQDELAAGSYHVTTCSLFMHHLDEPEAVKLLKFMQQTASELALVDDLKRTKLGYTLAWVGCRLLSRCHVVHVDGPRSVEGAFTENEAMQLAAKADWNEPNISSHWPERFLMTSRVNA
jgi:2-polyprenyl-3-methyl-5-hydroxy-6-metoxy-1,4-benzoquinol methylase